MENERMLLLWRAGRFRDKRTLPCVGIDVREMWKTQPLRKTSAERMEEANNSRDQQQSGESTWNRRRCRCSPPTRSGCHSVDMQLVTLSLESGKFLSFKPDTRAQSNVIPLHLYKKATDDHELTNLQPERASLIAYGGSKLGVVGQAQIIVWRGDNPCLADCRFIDHQEMRPLLGRKACLGMGILQ